MARIGFWGKPIMFGRSFHQPPTWGIVIEPTMWSVEDNGEPARGNFKSDSLESSFYADLTQKGPRATDNGSALVVK